MRRGESGSGRITGEEWPDVGAEVMMAGGSRFAGSANSEDWMNMNASGTRGWSGSGNLTARNRASGVTSVDSGCYFVSIHEINEK